VPCAHQEDEQLDLASGQNATCGIRRAARRPAACSTVRTRLRPDRSW